MFPKYPDDADAEYDAACPAFYSPFKYGHGYEDDYVISRGCRIFNKTTVYAKYMAKMSAQHPIMYLLLYRWWVPLLLRKGAHEHLYEEIEAQRSVYMQAFWLEFSSIHPVQYGILLLFRLLVYHIPIKTASAFIKVVKRTVKYCSRFSAKKGHNEVEINNEVTEE